MPKIVVEVIIAGLDQQHCDKFRNNLEFWRAADQALIGPGGVAALGQAGVEPAVRIRFEGAYDPEADEFTAKTWFAIPRQDDGTPTSECRSSDKREFGFFAPSGVAYRQPGLVERFAPGAALRTILAVRVDTS